MNSFRDFLDEAALFKQLLDRLDRDTKFFKMNHLSVFIVLKWLEWRIKQKGANPKLKTVSRLIIDNLVSQLADIHVLSPSKLLFILDITESTLATATGEREEDGQPPAKKRRHEEKRPPLMGNVVQPLEALALLIHKFDKNAILLNDNIFSMEGSFESIMTGLRKPKAKSAALKSWPDDYENIIYVTLNGIVPTSDVDSYLRKFPSKKILVLSIMRQKEFRIKNPSRSMNLLTVNGFDKHIFSLIAKHFGTFV